MVCAAIDELIECRFLMRIGSYLAVVAGALLRQERTDEARETVARVIACTKSSKASVGAAWSCCGSMRRSCSMQARLQRAEKLPQEALVEARAIGALTYQLRIGT